VYLCSYRLGHETSFVKINQQGTVTSLCGTQSFRVGPETLSELQTLTKDDNLSAADHKKCRENIL